MFQVVVTICTMLALFRIFRQLRISLQLTSAFYVALLAEELIHWNKIILL